MTKAQLTAELERLKQQYEPEPTPTIEPAESAFDNADPGSWLERWLQHFSYDFVINILLVGAFGLFCYVLPSAIVGYFPDMPVRLGEVMLTLGTASMKFFFAKVIISAFLYISENSLYKFYRSPDETAGKMTYRNQLKLSKPDTLVWLAFVKSSLFLVLFVLLLATS